MENTTTEITVKDDRIPFVTPILSLLRSRKVMIAIATLATSVLVTKFPELSGYQDLLITGLLALGLMLIGGTTVEDAVVKARKDAITVGDVGTVNVELKDLLRVSLEEKLLDSNKTEEEKQILRELLERILSDIHAQKTTVAVKQDG